MFVHLVGFLKKYSVKTGGPTFQQAPVTITTADNKENLYYFSLLNIRSMRLTKEMHITHIRKQISKHNRHEHETKF